MRELKVSQCNVGTKADNIQSERIANLINARPPTEQVSIDPAATIEHIGTGTAVDQIVAFTGIDHIVTAKTGNRVAARRVFDPVGSAGLRTA